MIIKWTNADDREGDEDPPKLRAAQYVRMSTEHQQYSTDNQAAAILKYAEQNGYAIVRTYSDEGRSGLNIDGRPAFRQLLDDIESGQADYQVLLVYDISRWGRFQDPDEAASYDFRCRKAGVDVRYCAEEYVNEGGMLASIMKTVKHLMAGEYSRELSVKVFAGSANLIRLGFRQGGIAGFGLRRLLVDRNGPRRNSWIKASTRASRPTASSWSPARIMKWR
jgi:DNA invertase Pin-like site-specific DNA recombinase